VVAIIRAKLADGTIAKGVNAADLAALQSFYAGRSTPPLWITEMGFSAKGQDAISEIEKADDWGLDAKAFDLPASNAIPGSPDSQAEAEIKLDFAVLKYARYARGGRVVPAAVSKLYDENPPIKAPTAVLTEIEAAGDPGAYLVSLQPKHEQFLRLRQALLKARGKSAGEAKSTAKKGDEAGETQAAAAQGEKKTAKDETPARASDRDIKRLIVNMERWRWLPQDLGPVYVWNNAPEYMLYVVKHGKPIYADKILVGTLNYATPVFSDQMETIVFNPDWVAPETVVKENLLPALRQGNYSILQVHKLLVRYNGAPVDPTKVAWNRVNGMSYTFLQKGGAGNNLGKIKFLYPNKHVVYMHDTVQLRKKYFNETVRMIGHECVRMEKPLAFAQTLLAAGNNMPATRVKDLWDNGVNSAVALQNKLPVYMVYFTAVAGENGKVSTYADMYGLDRKLAAALFGDAKGFPEPPPDNSTALTASAASSGGGGGTSRRASSSASGNGIASTLGFIDN
jgi:murein L,D-transpeptidase YcbB/YkuD